MSGHCYYILRSFCAISLLAFSVSCEDLLMQVKIKQVLYVYVSKNTHGCFLFKVIVIVLLLKVQSVSSLLSMHTVHVMIIIVNSKVTKAICMSAISPFLFDQSFKGFDDPLAEFETTFQEVVKRLRQKFRYLHVLSTGSHEQN